MRSRPATIIAEIETDKATMEVEAVDEGRLSQILVPAGTENVKVNTPIALIEGEDESAGQLPRTEAKSAGPGEEPGARVVASRAPSPQPSPRRGEGGAASKQHETASPRLGEAKLRLDGGRGRGAS